jgi:hypothetical protein
VIDTLLNTIGAGVLVVINCSLITKERCLNEKEHRNFDDKSKLNGHDLGAVSKLLKDATARLLQAKGNSLDLGELNGQWYIESTTESSINVTITGAKASDLIGETVIDKKKRAGQIFYSERNAAALTVN